MIRSFFLVTILLCSFLTSRGQQPVTDIVIDLTVVNEEGSAVPGAEISLKSSGASQYTVYKADADGHFSQTIPYTSTLHMLIEGEEFRSVKVTFKDLQQGEVIRKQIQLSQQYHEMGEINISYKGGPIQDPAQVSTIRIDPKLAPYVPSVTGDFNKMLAVVGLGVSTQSEFSSAYNVRGGSYEENLVYVNNVEVYRPFLVRNGQQEGLSFVNPNMVSKVEFSAGGWQPKYGDKLSSVLNVRYKEPTKFQGSVTLSLLYNAINFEDRVANDRITILVGARQKSTRYILNTLDTKGEYKPRFYDLQSYITFDLTHRKDSTDRERRSVLGVLTSYANNDYLVEPATRTTNFGTQQNPVQLEVAYDGKATYSYSTFQGALNFQHKFSDKVDAEIISSVVHTAEREYYDIESGYRLCDLTDDGSGSFNNCATVTGLGTFFNHGRNKLIANIFNVQMRANYKANDRNTFQFGLLRQYEWITDTLNEYDWSDSAGYVSIDRYVNTQNYVTSSRNQAYLQHEFRPDSTHVLVYGVRFNYWSLNGQFLVSPRLQYAFRPKWKNEVWFRLGTGWYQQPPFYRELRNINGIVNPNVKAQSSVHLILGMDHMFRSWGRKFRFLTEAYVKYITNIVPYYTDNMKLRYFGYNDGVAYAMGMDFRVSGEFVKGNESWFNLSVMQTKENIKSDNKGWVPRPTDQRVIATIFYQDNIPNVPSLKVYLSLVYASPLPFGPPGDIDNRAALRMKPYRRVDIGFSKLLTIRDKSVEKKTVMESIWISLEVLNLFGVTNTISYNWVPDFSGAQYAVPNTLSQRFVNLKIIAKF